MALSIYSSVRSVYRLGNPTRSSKDSIGCKWSCSIFSLCLLSGWVLIAILGRVQNGAFSGDPWAAS